MVDPALAPAAAGAGLAAGAAVSGYVRRQGSKVPAWVVAAGPAVLWAALALAMGWERRLLPAAGLTLGLWAAACIDLSAYRIPNALNASIAVLGAAAAVLRASLAPPLPSLLSGLAAGALFALLALVTRGGFGWGDAKLAAALGWVLGPAATERALAATALLGGLAAAALLAARRRGARDPLPFAPFFLAGGLFALAGLAVH